ncbi:MAG: hypothetical protein M3Z64_07680 [Verrucomicrobiota bacterium]|nr:hypothetical protein [Verrucomicrobiota bacterium]
MIEEPYRWVEAIANRREYIETQLGAGSPIVALSFADGILFVTQGQSQHKIFEIYDRIALGAIGHPGDIERLRMAAIEVASTEGFARSAADVSLRRLAHYSLSPVLKTAFEQVYGAPYLATLLFAEIGAAPAQDLFLRMEYDGAISTNGEGSGEPRDAFGAISGARQSTEAMENILRDEHDPKATFAAACKTGLRAVAVATLAVGDSADAKSPTHPQIETERARLGGAGNVQAVILERASERAIRYRAVSEAEIRAALGD